MLLHCDLVYASDDVRFSFPFINLGISPERGTSSLLPRLAGYRKAMEMVLFGEQFGVDEAESFGLINEVVSGQSVFDRAMNRAKFLSARSSDSMQAAKRLLKSSKTDAIAQAMDRERDLFSERLSSDETQAAIAGF
jgi:enoyl-CoA hydratase/carnithine racemase